MRATSHICLRPTLCSTVSVTDDNGDEVIDDGDDNAVVTSANAVEVSLSADVVDLDDELEETAVVVIVDVDTVDDVELWPVVGIVDVIVIAEDVVDVDC